MPNPLDDVPQDKVFICVNGDVIHNLVELHSSIDSMGQEDFDYHVTEAHDDFRRWISETFGCNRLVKNLKNVKEKKVYSAFLAREIRNLGKDVPEDPKIISSFRYYQFSQTFARPIILIIFLALIIISTLSVQNIILSQKFSDLAISQDNLNNQFQVFIEDMLRNQDKQTGIFYDLGVQFNDSSYFIVQEILKERALESIQGPPDYLNNIIVQDNFIELPDNNYALRSVGKTGSMSPVLNQYSNIIEVIPKDESDIQIGQIISFSFQEDIIVHRVLNIGVDNKGWYVQTKGDSNETPDPYVRFSQIKGIVVGIIY